MKCGDLIRYFKARVAAVPAPVEVFVALLRLVGLPTIVIPIPIWDAIDGGRCVQMLPNYTCKILAPWGSTDGPVEDL